MSEPFSRPFFSDSEFDSLKLILSSSPSISKNISQLQMYLEQLPEAQFEDEVKRVRVMLLSLLGKKKITKDDINGTTPVIEIKIKSDLNNSELDKDSPQYKEIIEGINAELKEKVEQLTLENLQLREKIDRQAEEFRQIDQLADKLINHKGNE